MYLRATSTLTAIALALYALNGSALLAEDCVSDNGQCDVAAHTAKDTVLKGELGQLVHDYLLANPKILSEMAQVLRTQKITADAESQRKSLQDNHSAIFNGPDDPTLGNPTAATTIVEWFDAECPYCKQLAPTLQRLVNADSDVRVVLKEFPILGEGSTVAAKAELAALLQGADKYRSFHDALMADKTPEHHLALPRISEIAIESGLDLRRLKVDMELPAISAQIAKTKSLAASLGITGTPGLIIGNQIISGAMSFESLINAVAAARAAKTEG